MSSLIPAESSRAAQEVDGSAALRAMSVAQLIDRVREMVGNQADPSVATAQSICELMGHLAAQEELWSAADFPIEEDKLWQAYQLQEDPDGSFALYAVAMKPGHRQPPHNHTTWAVIAGVRGFERNDLYVRDSVGDGEEGRIRSLSAITVGKGKVLAMGANDIHSIEVFDPEVSESNESAHEAGAAGSESHGANSGGATALHLHLYGRGLSHLNDRLIFDLETGVGRPFPIIQGLK